MTSSRAIVASLCLWLAAPAWAQDAPSAPAADEKESLEHYQKGVTAYDLGKFDEAVQEFQKAYEIKPTPAYLYNIAQAHRQKGDARKALFFYRRYLQKSPAASNRETVERRIAELEEQVKKQDDAAPKARDKDRDKDTKPAREAKLGTPKEPPERSAPPPAPPATRAATSRPRAAVDTTVATRVAPAPSPSRVRLSVEAGPAFMGLGDGPTVPVQVSVGAGLAFTVHLGDLALDLGVAGSLTPVPFETLERQDSGTAMVVAALGNVGLRFPVGPRLAVRGEAGGGVSMWSGLADRNPFTDGGAASDALWMPHVRVALGLDYALGRTLRLTVTPAFAWSAASDTFDDDISSITRLDVLAGVALTL